VHIASSRSSRTLKVYSRGRWGRCLDQIIVAKAIFHKIYR